MMISVHYNQVYVCWRLDSAAAISQCDRVSQAVCDSLECESKQISCRNFLSCLVFLRSKPSYMSLELEYWQSLRVELLIIGKMEICKDIDRSIACVGQCGMGNPLWVSGVPQGSLLVSFLFSVIVEKASLKTADRQAHNATQRKLSLL